MDLSYRQLQVELKTLRDKGSIAPNLKLNVSQKELQKVYRDYLNRQERKQTLDNPLIVVWLAMLCLVLGVGAVWLGLEVVVIMVKATYRFSTMLANLQVWTDAIIQLQNIMFRSRASKFT